jgi:hypothetical protein
MGVGRHSMGVGRVLHPCPLFLFSSVHFVDTPTTQLHPGLCLASRLMFPRRTSNLLHGQLLCCFCLPSPLFLSTLCVQPNFLFSAFSTGSGGFASRYKSTPPNEKVLSRPDQAKALTTFPPSHVSAFRFQDPPLHSHVIHGVPLRKRARQPILRSAPSGRDVKRNIRPAQEHSGRRRNETPPVAHRLPGLRIYR